jgi:hypothetical protein
VRINQWLAISLLVFSCCTSAQTLKQQQAQRVQEGYLAEEVTDFNEACGTEIPVDINWSSFKPADYDTEYSIYSYCAVSIETLASMCREDDGLAKKAIGKQIQRVVCHLGSARSAKLSSGTLDYTMHFGSSNDADYLREFLGENL